MGRPKVKKIKPLLYRGKQGKMEKKGFLKDRKLVKIVSKTNASELGGKRSENMTQCFTAIEITGVH